MVIVPLLTIELKATPNGNPTNDFYWLKSCSLNAVPIIFHRPNLYSLTEKFEQPGDVGIQPRSCSYLANLILT